MMIDKGVKEERMLWQSWLIDAGLTGGDVARAVGTSASNINQQVARGSLTVGRLITILSRFDYQLRIVPITRD